MSAPADPKALKLTIGPVPYLWDGEKWRDFYFRIAESPQVDAVTLGEVVCSKRDHFTRPYLDAVVERLTASGKAVALASLALVTLEREAIATRRLARSALPVEANDLSALRLLAGRPHLVGPFVNVYNGATARLLAESSGDLVRRGLDFVARSRAMPWDEAGALARQIRSEWFRHPDFAEGVAAVAERRKPDWPSLRESAQEAEL